MNTNRIFTYKVLLIRLYFASQKSNAHLAIMSSSNGNDATKINATSAITTTNVNYTKKELKDRMERNRLEAQGKRNAAQRETANALQNLTDQMQTQIQKLQERAKYDEIRCQAVADTSQNLKFTDSLVYVNTFNPSVINADPLPTQRAPDCPQISKLLFAVKEGILSPEMVNWIMVNMHNMGKSLDKASTKTSTMLKMCPPVDSDTDDGPPPLLPYLRSESLRHPSTCNDTCTDNLSPVSVATDNVDVVDLTDLSDDNANEPSNKKYKTATIEVNLRVKMPGNNHPIMKNYQFNIHSNGSSVGDNK
jgi:hypothetical protein